MASFLTLQSNDQNPHQQGRRESPVIAASIDQGLKEHGEESQAQHHLACPRKCQLVNLEASTQEDDSQATCPEFGAP